METTVRMIDVISETLLEDTVAGDPLHLMNYGDLVWIVAKMTGEGMAHFSLEFPNLGALTYPADVFVDEIPTCVEMKVSITLIRDAFNSSPPEQNIYHFADDISICIFVNENI